MKALILDDEFKFRDEIAGLLREVDFETTCCQNEEEVDAFFAQARTDQSLLPDVMLFDINLSRSGGARDGGIRTAAKWYPKVQKPLIIISQHFDEPEFTEQMRRHNLPTHNFLNKEDLKNPEIFIERVYYAIHQHSREHLAEWIFRSRRKVGFTTEKGETDFIGADDIVYVEPVRNNPHHTLIYLEDGNILEINTHLRPVGNYLYFNFPNLFRLNRSLYVNLEKIHRIVDKTIYFTNGKYTDMSGEDMKRLRDANLVFRART